MAISSINLTTLSRAYSTISPGSVPFETSSSRNLFLSKLEKHISEYRSGIATTVPEIPYELSREQGSAANTLALSAPKSLAAYSGYLTALSYSQKARFVSGTYQATAAFSTLTSPSAGGALNTLI